MKHKKKYIQKIACYVQCWSISKKFMKKYLKILYSQIKTDFFFINFVSDLDHFEVIKKIVKKTIEPLRSRDQKNLRDHPSIRNCK